MLAAPGIRAEETLSVNTSSQNTICPKELLQYLCWAPEESFEGHNFSDYSSVFQVQKVSIVYRMQLTTVINSPFCSELFCRSFGISCIQQVYFHITAISLSRSNPFSTIMKNNLDASQSLLLSRLCAAGSLSLFPFSQAFKMISS